MEITSQPFIKSSTVDCLDNCPGEILGRLEASWEQVETGTIFRNVTFAENCSVVADNPEQFSGEVDYSFNTTEDTLLWGQNLERFVKKTN